MPFDYKRNKQDLEGDTSLPDALEFHRGHSDISNVRSVLSINERACCMYLG